MEEFNFVKLFVAKMVHQLEPALLAECKPIVEFVLQLGWDRYKLNNPLLPMTSCRGSQILIVKYFARHAPFLKGLWQMLNRFGCDSCHRRKLRRQRKGVGGKFLCGGLHGAAVALDQKRIVAVPP